MAFRSLRFLVPLAAVAGWFVAAWGCSATDTNPVDTSSSGSPSGTGGEGGTGSTTGMGGSTGQAGGISFGGNSGQGGFSPDAACVASAVEAEPITLDMVIVLDRSGSMSGPNWNGSVDALTTFVNAPASAGINVGILYFPATNLGGLDDCDYTVYDDLIVPIAELPGNAPAMVASLDAENPLGGTTPIYGALKGALFAATAYQDANPTHKVITVFASDGDPNSCPGNQNQIPVIAQLAASALNYNGVQTFVIAIQGATLSNLNQIAAAGGTNAAYDVTGDINAFAQKMAEIQAAAVQCEFIIPEAPPGEMLDYNKVAVKFTPGGGMPTEVPKAEDAADCGAGPGWYYDNNVTPTKIILCPASCAQIQNDTQAKVDVLFGCEPDVN